MLTNKEEYFREHFQEYYAQLDISTITLDEWCRWLVSLPDNIKKDMITKGFEYCLYTLPMQRWVLEDRGFTLEKFTAHVKD